MREHLDAEGLAEELAGDGAGRDAGGGFAGAGPLEYRSGVVEFVLEHAGIVGVAGPRPGQRRVARDFEFRGVDGVGGHHGLPLRPLGVADLDGDRAAERDAVAHARQHGDLVALEFHPGAAAVAEAAAGQLVGDVVGGDRQPGDHAFDHGHQSSAVGFTSSSPSQHESHLPTTGLDREKRRWLRDRRDDPESLSEELPVSVTRISPKLFVVQALPVFAQFGTSRPAVAAEIRDPRRIRRRL